jgi:hypothetical protein
VIYSKYIQISLYCEDKYPKLRNINQFVFRDDSTSLKHPEEFGSSGEVALAISPAVQPGSCPKNQSMD